MAEMDRAKHAQTQEMLLSLAGIAHQLGSRLDLDAFIAAAGHAHAVGPILDPTAYRAGHERMDAIAGLARATQRYLRAVEECKAVIERTEGQAQRYREHVEHVREALDA